ncbi:hypothetical protein BN6_32860 [Saccharothrix espanaensis DSM 44229]|uniref:Uncharacterized protein n=1 Tax=Saccharothrix espanaensis (strain ATCC 51144 / DSM 44229 / JCM 9112 / NBRC 15066 / NRRL 15764) TaxID=1179773 RepID=K0JSF6_SACES|nr:hypothetical protein BN6_32860 [Saccharothrix espanaensis DSM 44229]
MSTWRRSRARVSRHPQENPQFYSLDVQRFLDLLARKPTWNDLGVTPDDARSVAVGTADVCRSGTAAGYLGLAAFAVGSVPATLEDARSIATRLKPLVQQQGTPAPAVPLSDESPLVVTSEHRYFANPFGSVALVYPRTPLRLRQTYTALTPEAERLGDLLVSDPELLRAAARSGYRAYPPADGLFDQARDEQGVARPDAVRDDRFAVLPEPDVFREMVRVVGDCGGSGGG